MNVNHETAVGQAAGPAAGAAGMPAETATATTGENARARVNGRRVWLPLPGVAALIVVFSSGRSLAGQPSASAGPATT